MIQKKHLWMCIWFMSLLSLAFLCTAEAGETSGKASGAKPAGAEALSEAKVDINRAGPEQLSTLPGVGAKTADRIIQYRETNGKFKTVEDLKKVRGIGDRKFEKMKPHIKI